MKFPNLSIVTGLDIETAATTAVTRVVKSIVLSFADVFKLYNFKGSPKLLFNVKSWIGAGIVDLM